jgi:hypothetical protein
MIALLLGLFLLHASPQGSGVVTGLVRSSTGSPAARVRVYAITYRDAVEAANLPPALEGLAETDASGRYRLELAPGRYHIAIGAVAAPTYYPNRRISRRHESSPSKGNWLFRTSILEPLYRLRCRVGRRLLRSLPEEYEIKSLNSGTVELLKETLKVSGKDPVDVEIRVARRSIVAGAARLSGALHDSITGTPVAGRLTLCCADSGPAEKFSTPVGADGSFAFTMLPPGKYTPALQRPGGAPALYIVGSGLDVGPQALQGMTLFTAVQFGQVSATIQSDEPDPLPENVAPSIVFVNPVSGFRVLADRNPAGFYVAMLPRGARYSVSVENLPEGIVVGSLPDSVEPGTASPVSVTIGRAEAPRP